MSAVSKDEPRFLALSFVMVPLALAPAIFFTWANATHFLEPHQSHPSSCIVNVVTDACSK